MTLRRHLLAASILATIGFATAAPAAEAQTRGGTLTFGRAIESQFLDPTRTAQNADIWISLNIYDTLLQPTADGKGVQAGLAGAWDTSADGKTVTLTLRPGLKFADGSPLQASDAAWSLNQARAKPEGGEFAFLLTSIANVTAEGADKVVVTLSKPDPVILQALATFNAGVMPEKLLMAEPGATIDDKRKTFADHPVGSGPFTLESWKRNTEMVLVRNPHYWRQAADGKALPYLDRVRLQIIPDDATRILKLRAGELDIAEFVPYSRVAELKADPKLDMVLFPAAQVNYFSLNARPTFKDGSKNPMADVRVRQALNYATNKQALIQAVSYGAGSVQRSFMPMSTPFAYGPEPLYPYNVAKARQLLAEAGYPNGFELTAMALAGSADDAAKLTILQQLWNQVGVKLKIEQLDAATRLARFNAGDFQLRASLWTNDINDPSQVTSIFAYYPTRQAGRTGWQDKRIDELYEASQAELDPVKRAAEFKEIQERFAAGAPIIFAMEVPYPVAMRKQVRGFVQIPLGNNLFVEASVEK
ncbi:MAG: ABC transporter substrate-binding protein [Janthinobacterium lividum]